MDSNELQIIKSAAQKKWHNSLQKFSSPPIQSIASAINDTILLFCELFATEYTIIGIIASQSNRNFLRRMKMFRVWTIFQKQNFNDFDFIKQWLNLTQLPAIKAIDFKCDHFRATANERN